MNVELFLALLVISANATAVLIQIIKEGFHMFNKEYNAVTLAVVVSFIIGVVEIIGYYAINGLEVNGLTFLYSICLGIANASGATTSYDLVKKFIKSLFGE